MSWQSELRDLMQREPRGNFQRRKCWEVECGSWVMKHAAEVLGERERQALEKLGIPDGVKEDDECSQ